MRLRLQIKTILSDAFFAVVRDSVDDGHAGFAVCAVRFVRMSSPMPDGRGHLAERAGENRRQRGRRTRSPATRPSRTSYTRRFSGAATVRMSGGSATRPFIEALMIWSRMPGIGFPTRRYLRSLDARNSAHPILFLGGAVGLRLGGRDGLFDDESGAQYLKPGYCISYNMVVRPVFLRSRFSISREPPVPTFGRYACS